MLVKSVQLFILISVIIDLTYFGYLMPHANLTAKFVASLACPAGKRKIEFIDTALEGFFVEALSSGVKTYYQRYIDGHRKQRQIRIGRVGIVPLEDARRRALQIKATVSLGGDPKQEKTELQQIPTLRTFVCERYIPFIKRAKRSWVQDDRLLRNHILPALGDFYLDEITTSMILDFRQKLQAKGYANGSCNRPVVLLRYIFNLAADWGVPRLGTNPAKKVPMLEETERQRFLTDAETRRLLEVLHTSPHRAEAQAIELLLITGARLNEILRARWEYVDFEKSSLLVPLSKSGKPRFIALSSAAVDLLNRLESKGKSDWLFPLPSADRPLYGLQHRWIKIRQEAGMPDLRIHDLRHSYASFLVNGGVSLYVVQELLGHSQPRTTQRYAHLQRTTLTQAANLAADAVKRAVG